MKKPIVKSGQDWTFDLLDEVYEHIYKIAKEKYRLNVYPNQLEVISSEQMLEAYTSGGLPIFYTHWSFGKMAIREAELYKRGAMGLAYEIVINSNPCISYIMEENTMLMQTLVIAHAAMGHNHFFKNNYMFKLWTDADDILDYLSYAKKFIAKCEDQYGIDRVEEFLDNVRSLSNLGVYKYKRTPKKTKEQIRERDAIRDEVKRENENPLWKTIPENATRDPYSIAYAMNRYSDIDPDENVLRFIGENSPVLESWQREIINIECKIQQYFYPQRQTQVMNEGFATYCHYKIIHDLHADGVIDDGALLEFYHSHSGVLYQGDYTRTSKLNPYALGFAMFMDIERIATNPTDEDREWFGNQSWVGSNDPQTIILSAVNEYKDESFIRQFLSPKIIRDFKLFSLTSDEENKEFFEVSAIHNSRGYKRIRSVLANQYDIGRMEPDIQVFDVNFKGDRELILVHNIKDGKQLNADDATVMMANIRDLWGEYPITLSSVLPNDSEKCIYSMDSNGKITMDFFLSLSEI